MAAQLSPLLIRREKIGAEPAFLHLVKLNVVKLNDIKLKSLKFSTPKKTIFRSNQSNRPNRVANNLGTHGKRLGRHRNDGTEPRVFNAFSEAIQSTQFLLLNGHR